MTVKSLSAEKPQALVSVVSITYNHKKYIKQALDSFLSQQTDFTYEIVICDDASTDGTSQIVAEYAERYPDQIRATLRLNNIGAQANFVDALTQAKGDYIALCEGDDFWTDPFKLQAQVDFLEKNPDCSICFHPARVFFENNDEPDHVFPIDRTGFTQEKLLKGNFIQTNSVMYRRQDYANLPIDILPLDWYLHLYHAQFGKIGFINKVMSAYRRHSDGLWWGSHKNKAQLWKKHGLAHMRLYSSFRQLCGDDKAKQLLVDNLVITLFDEFVGIDKTQGRPLLMNVIQNFPEETEVYLRDVLKRSMELNKHSRKQARLLSEYSLHNNQLKDALDETGKIIDKLSRENAALKSSIPYKATRKIKNVSKKLKLHK